MPAILIHADTVRSPDLRHEVPLAVPDPFLYVEQDGRRVAVVTALEAPRIAGAAPGVETIPPERLGIDELLASGTPPANAELEIYRRACAELDVVDAAVPPGFPLELADHLRAAGVGVHVDRGLFEDRRRRKTAPELEGLRRAQRACEAALDAAARRCSGPPRPPAPA